MSGRVRRGRGSGWCRGVAGVLLVLALLAGSGADAAQDDGDDDGGATGPPSGIDLPFTDDDEEATPAGASEDGPSFVLTAYVCDPGDDTDLRDRMLVESSTDPDAFFEDGIEVEELRSVCDPPAEAITYTLTADGEDGGDAREIGGAEDPATTWTGLPGAGSEYTLGAPVPETYGDPIVRCTVASDPPGTTTQYYATDGTIRFSLAVGRDHTCEWFNVDLGDGGAGVEASPVADAPPAVDAAISIRAYTCDAGDDPELAARIAYQAENWTTVDPERGIGIDELREDCKPADGSIAFTVTEDQSGAGDERAVGGTDAVSWELEPLTSYAIAADEPDGYGEPLLFCALDGGEPSQSPVIEGDLFLILGEGVTDSCDWFHVDLGG